jgi:sugar lactone lactonase YvrE
MTTRRWEDRILVSQTAAPDRAGAAASQGRMENYCTRFEGVPTIARFSTNSKRHNPNNTKKDGSMKNRTTISETPRCAPSWQHTTGVTCAGAGATGPVTRTVKATGFRRRLMAASAFALLTFGAFPSLDARADDGWDTLYVGDVGGSTVTTFDAATGFFKDTLIPATAGLNSPQGMVFSDGTLFLINQNAGLPIPGDILRFNGERDDGSLLKKIVPALLEDGSNNPNAPAAPRGMVISNGRIIVATFTDDPLANPNDAAPPNGSVREYSGSGRLILPLMKADQIGIDSFHPRGVVIGPDGLLYVSNSPNLRGPNGHIVRFDPVGRKFKDIFVDNSDGTAADCTKDLNRPEGLVFGPDGRLYVTTFRASGADPVKQDTDAILIFDGPGGAHPGACVDQIDLDAPGTVSSSGNRAFAQALLFGSRGDLFVPITGNGKDTGSIRRYDVHGKTFTAFVSADNTPLQSPFYLTFGKTNPNTLAYDDEGQD